LKGNINTEESEKILEVVWEGRRKKARKREAGSRNLSPALAAALLPR